MRATLAFIVLLSTASPALAQGAERAAVEQVLKNQVQAWNRHDLEGS